MNQDTFTIIALVALTIISALISFYLAKLDIRDKRKRYLGFFPRDIKNYAAYISFISAIFLVFLQTKKEINTNSDLQMRYWKVDSLTAKHFDSTYHAIDSTQKLQKRTIESIANILSRQTVELEYQQRVLEANSKILKGQSSEFVQIKNLMIEADAIEGSNIDIYWTINTDQSTINKFCSIYVNNNFPKNCSPDYANGNFTMQDTCLKKFPSTMESASIFFIKNNIDKAITELSFLKDTIKFNDMDNEYPAVLSKLPDYHFKHFSPDLSLDVSNKINVNSWFYCSKAENKMNGISNYNVRFLAKNNQRVPFFDLSEMYAMVVINSQLNKFWVDKMILNSKGRDNCIILTFDKPILQRECISSIKHDNYTQSIFFAKISSCWR